MNHIEKEVFMLDITDTIFDNDINTLKELLNKNGKHLNNDEISDICIMTANEDMRNLLITYKKTYKEIKEQKAPELIDGTIDAYLSMIGYKSDAKDIHSLIDNLNKLISGDMRKIIGEKIKDNKCIVYYINDPKSFVVNVAMFSYIKITLDKLSVLVSEEFDNKKKLFKFSAYIKYDTLLQDNLITVNQSFLFNDKDIITNCHDILLANTYENIHKMTINEYLAKTLFKELHELYYSILKAYYLYVI